MRILITNDDGIGSPALPVLARQLTDAGHSVRVVAPMAGYSGCGASIGSVSEGHRIRIDRAHLTQAEQITAYAVDAPPAFIVLAALQGLFGEPPEVLVSGTNSGLNLGPLVLHSGTLGAAVTAAAHGLPAVALSTEKQPRHGYDTAARFCARHLETLVKGMGSGTALNINVPDLPMDAITGVRQTRLAPRSLVAIHLLDDTPAEAGDAQRLMRIELEHDHDRALHRQWRQSQVEPDDSDAGAIVDHCISVTLIHGGLHPVAHPPGPWSELSIR